MSTPVAGLSTDATIPYLSTPGFDRPLHASHHTMLNSVAVHQYMHACTTQAAAVEVDAAVLAVGPDGASGELEALAKRKHDCLVKTPHTWVRSTEDNLRDAQHWLTDAARWV